VASNYFVCKVCGSVNVVLIKRVSQEPFVDELFCDVCKDKEAIIKTNLDILNPKLNVHELKPPLLNDDEYKELVDDLSNPELDAVGDLEDD
jgi:hypothetical protein